MENIELSTKEKEFLLDQSYTYRFETEHYEKAMKKLSEIINKLIPTFIDNGNTLSYQCSRIKEENSLLNKLLKKYRKAEESGKEIERCEDMHDIVGFRLICGSPSDVYAFDELIKNCSDLNIDPNDYDDYIKKPKASGYMSLHRTVGVPIDTPIGVQYVKCEIQLRTIFEDTVSHLEHKYGYKGNTEDEDKEMFKQASSTLFSLDYAIDRTFENYKPKKASKEELQPCELAYVEAMKTYKIMLDQLNASLNLINNEKGVVKIVSRLKPTQSVLRKLQRNGAEITADNILYTIRDIFGVTIVCEDKIAAKEIIKKLKENINNNKFKITDEKNHLDEAKDSGYRGYKMNIAPTFMNGGDINAEIIVTTPLAYAWAQHHDKVFNREDYYASSEEYELTYKILQGFSNALCMIEDNFSKLIQKYKDTSITTAMDLVSEIEQFKAERDTQKLIYKPNKNEE